MIEGRERVPRAGGEETPNVTYGNPYLNTRSLTPTSIRDHSPPPQYEITHPHLNTRSLTPTSTRDHSPPPQHEITHPHLNTRSLTPTSIIPVRGN